MHSQLNMWCPTVTALLIIVQFCTAAAVVNGTLSSGDTISFDLEISTIAPEERPDDGTLRQRVFVEPILSFESVCDPFGYSGLYQRHRLTLPIIIGQSTTEVNMSVIRIEARIDDALLGTDASFRVTAQLSKQPGKAHLIFLCATFARCLQLKESIDSDPEELWRSINFTVQIKSASRSVRFDGLRSDNLPAFSCDPSSWIVFQRRIDGSLSFVQNWDAYVNGFGSPDSNYWMGLDRLFAMTATGKKSSFHDTSRCRLRVELQDFNGTSYWGEYGQFQVLDPAQNYRLRLGQPAADSQLAGFVDVHGESQFSTYDRKHDRLTGDSCSQLYGYGGWWYGACHHVNLNGAYLTNRSVTDSPIYASFRYTNKFVPVKFTEMKFKCGK